MKRSDTTAGIGSVFLVTHLLRDLGDGKSAYDNHKNETYDSNDGKDQLKLGEVLGRLILRRCQHDDLTYERQKAAEHEPSKPADDCCRCVRLIVDDDLLGRHILLLIRLLICLRIGLLVNLLIRLLVSNGLNALGRYPATGTNGSAVRYLGSA